MNNRFKLTFRKKFAIMVFALYVTFILLSAIPYIAESQVRGVQDMDAQYTYNLKFEIDGEQSHYVVERNDAAKPGTIELTYITTSHTLTVKTVNIKNLTIDCQSIYEDESMKVFKENPSGEYYKDYFKEHDKPLSVSVITDHVLEIRFKNAPKPVEVKLDDVVFTNYQVVGQDIIIKNVPLGSSIIEIAFKLPDDGDGDGDGEGEEEDDEEEEEDQGLFGLGKFGGIDTFIFLVLVVIIIILLIVVLMKKPSEAEEDEEEEEKEDEEEKLAEEGEEDEDEEIEETEEEEFECPDCGASLGAGVTECPECGAEFEEDEDEEIEDDEDLPEDEEPVDESEEPAEEEFPEEEPVKESEESVEEEFPEEEPVKEEPVEEEPIEKSEEPVTEEAEEENEELEE